METLVIFAIAIALITLLTLRYHLPPFLTLIAASLVYGVLAGLQGELVVLITTGAGRIFSLLGIPIFCGALIAQALRAGGLLQKIISDLQKISERPPIIAGIAGYLLALPFMCCITAFILLAPIVEHLGEGEDHRKGLVYLTAYGSVLSFVLLFPFPVVYAIVTTLEIPGFDPLLYTAVALPLSLLLLAAGMLFISRKGEIWMPSRADEQPVLHIQWWKAWAPVWVPLACIATGVVYPPLHVLSNVNIALLAGAAVALIITQKKDYLGVIEKGTRNAGIIIFDLCGAGAFGNVIAASAFADQIFPLLQEVLPIVVIPFLLAALIQAAQGSRVVTAVVTSSIVAGTPVLSGNHSTAVVLLIAGGALMFSYVSDPYFWLVKRMTGDSLRNTVTSFTLPLMAAGLIVFITGILLFMLI